MDTSDVTAKTGLSLSARRAWIEIYYADKDCDWVRGRSPQGERG